MSDPSVVEHLAKAGENQVVVKPREGPVVGRILRETSEIAEEVPEEDNWSSKTIL